MTPNAPRRRWRRNEKGRAMFTDIHGERPEAIPGAASDQSIGTDGASRRGGLTMRMLRGLGKAILDGVAVYGACAHGWPVKPMD
jgi:hypothetical protein